MNKLQLNRIVSRIKRGDEESFAQLYEATKKGVFSYVYSIVRDYQTAEDVMQDTYVKVKLNISKYRDGTNFAAWLLQIAKNTAYNCMRKSNREVATDEGSIPFPIRSAAV
ncbi:MAG: RNA polymerase sigma factor [Corallococcus sp.]|nr:RNA polymerase sigma factor [Corallococcus sp.]